MVSLLNTKYVAYINARRPHVSPCIDVSNIKFEIIDDDYFDIQDLKPTIKQPLGAGSATYKNPTNKIIVFIDYENFLKQIPEDLTKELKRCDFIAYDLGGKSFFLFE
ncbi:hypothetical protein Barb4_03458 [Bacteroidales bacterium Barb4]|nr:hypothetical protein Barb4_03458 [Bacteroidales bacterium Barb4]